MANLYIRKTDEATVREMKPEAVPLGLSLSTSDCYSTNACISRSGK
jgi:hypothetical protein